MTLACPASHVVQQLLKWGDEEMKKLNLLRPNPRVTIHPPHKHVSLPRRCYFGVI